MRNLDPKGNALLSCLLAGIVLALVLGNAYLFYFKKQYLDGFSQLRIETNLVPGPRTELLLAHTDQFLEAEHIPNTSRQPGILVFELPEGRRAIRKIRLDLGRNTDPRTIEITAFEWIGEGVDLRLDREEVFNSIANFSPSVNLDTRARVLRLKTDSKPFDPYLIFAAPGQMALKGSIYPWFLTGPLAILFLWYLFRNWRNEPPGVLEILLLLFALSIPLKIAWTTFAALLILAYALYRRIRSGPSWRWDPALILLTGVFLILITAGRPSAWDDLDIQLAYLLFAVLSGIASFRPGMFFRQYVPVFLFLNAYIAVHALITGIWSAALSGESWQPAVASIKRHSGDVLHWLPYGNAAFLCFFGLAGLIGAHRLWRQKSLPGSAYLAYHVLMLAAIGFTGTRICLAIYLILLLNLVIRVKPKFRIAGNAILLAGFATLLFTGIARVDENRSQLWRITWEAVAQRPWFGHGLGSSEDIIREGSFKSGETMVSFGSLNHSHSQYLTFLLETGIVGCLLLAGLLLFVMLRFRLYQNGPLMLFALASAYFALTESILQTSKPLYVLCMLLLVWVESRRNPIKN